MELDFKKLNHWTATRLTINQISILLIKNSAANRWSASQRFFPNEDPSGNFLWASKNKHHVLKQWTAMHKMRGATWGLLMRSPILVYYCTSTLNYRLIMGSGGQVAVISHTKSFWKVTLLAVKGRRSTLNSITHKISQD